MTLIAKKWSHQSYSTLFKISDSQHVSNYLIWLCCAYQFLNYFSLFELLFLLIFVFKYSFKFLPLRSSFWKWHHISIFLYLNRQCVSFSCIFFSFCFNFFIFCFFKSILFLFETKPHLTDCHIWTAIHAHYHFKWSWIFSLFLPDVQLPEMVTCKYHINRSYMLLLEVVLCKVFASLQWVVYRVSNKLLYHFPCPGSCLASFVCLALFHSLYVKWNKLHVQTKLLFFLLHSNIYNDMTVCSSCVGHTVPPVWTGLKKHLLKKCIQDFYQISINSKL